MISANAIPRSARSAALDALKIDCIPTRYRPPMGSRRNRGPVGRIDVVAIAAAVAAPARSPQVTSRYPHAHCRHPHHHRMNTAELTDHAAGAPDIEKKVARKAVEAISPPSSPPRKRRHCRCGRRWLERIGTAARALCGADADEPDSLKTDVHDILMTAERGRLWSRLRNCATPG